MVNWEYLAALDFSILWTYRSAFLNGLGISLLYTLGGTFLGLTLGCLVSIAGQSGVPPLRWTMVAFVELFRNTPLLVQLFWIHFALPVLTGINTTIYESGLLALTLNATVYFSEIVRAGILAVPRGQREAAISLGLGLWSQWRYVVIPQAMRVVIPPLANMVVSMFKGTAVLSILSIAELMRNTTRISIHSVRPVEIYTGAALLYFLVGAALMLFFAYLEKRTKIPGA